MDSPYAYKNFNNMWSSTRRVDLPKKDGYKFVSFQIVLLRISSLIRGSDLTCKLFDGLHRLITGMTSDQDHQDIGLGIIYVDYLCTSTDKIKESPRRGMSGQPSAKLRSICAVDNQILKNLRPFWERLDSDHFYSFSVPNSLKKK